MELTDEIENDIRENIFPIHHCDDECAVSCVQYKYPNLNKYQILGVHFSWREDGGEFDDDEFNEEDFL